MQPAASQQPNNNNSRSTVIIILALLLFALSGLLTGFATGAFIRSQPTAQQNNGGNNSSKSGTTTKVSTTPGQTAIAHATQTPGILTLGLGCPSVQAYVLQETPGNSYQVQAQATDGSGSCGSGKPLHVSGITCRLWFTKDNNFLDLVPRDRTKSISTLNQPFPKEKTDDITFDSSTPQVQMCNAQGVASWTYQLSSSFDKGTYYIIVLNDWQGTLYNWSARQITVS